MKFLHTSDWHLGRTLHGAPMLAHQRAFLEWLLQLALDRRVTAVLVAGDVYDRAVPPVDAVALLNDTLAAFARAGIAVVLTSGNHDSAVRLGFGSSLAAYAGVHLRTNLAAMTEPVIFDDVAGAVAVYGIPYLLPDAVMAELDADRSHTSVLTAAVARIRADASRRELDKVIVLAHAFVTGATPSESERDIRIGGIGDAPAAVFSGLTYAALGHLHGAQQVAANVRYAGSPLAFSFSERNHRKSVTLVDLDARGELAVELIATPVPRPMAEIRGRLDELLADAQGPPADAWVKAVLTDPRRPAAPMERLRDRWPNTLVLDFQPDDERIAPTPSDSRLRHDADPVEVCAQFIAWVDSTYPDRGQRDALAAVVEAVRDVERIA